MNLSTRNTGIVGARISPMDSIQSGTWLHWLNGGESPSSDTQGVQFALAHSDAGVTWGYLDEQQQWRLGSGVDPALCPVPDSKSLQELRIFGLNAEVLIWRGDDGLRGRILADADPCDPSDPLRPMDEGRRLRGESRNQFDGFKLWVDRGGAQHLAPETFPENFSVRNYFEQDPETGAARVAASRLLPVLSSRQKGD